MNVPAKNISQVGTILAVLLFLCGLFHHQLFVLFCTAIEGLMLLATGFFLLFLALLYGTVCLGMVLTFCFVCISPLLLIAHVTFGLNRL